MKKKQVAIINFNTPELTEACILSIRKHGCYWPVVVFDNSQSVVFPPGDGMKERTIEARPFTKKMNGVTVIDNTQGQVVNFEKELAKFPEKHIPHGGVNNWGSDLHMMTVEKLWELLPDGFILVESDVLVRTDIRSLWREEYSFCAYVQKHQEGNRFGRGRILPMLCYMNVPRFREEGVHYFDPDRSWMLHKGEENPLNWYDTGASLLEDVLVHRPRLKGLHVDIRPMIHHLGGGSYYENENQRREKWLKQHEQLWQYEEAENKDAKIYICTHKDFEKPVRNHVYEVVDARKKGKDVAPDGLRGSFYSEILTYQRVAAKKSLPKTVGFCGYRKYFEWFDYVPELEGRVMVSENLQLDKSLHEQYKAFSNVEDLDILTDIIDRHAKDFAPAWHKALEAETLHPYSMFVMPSDDFRRMMKLISDLLKRWVKKVGTDIEGRISANKEKYLLETPREGFSPENSYRIGGNLGERLVSAWIDWQFPDAEQVPVMITEERVW